MQSVGNRAIAVDGQVYNVHKTTKNNTGICTFAPVKAEAVNINGEKYYVTQAPDLFASDKTKDVVYINGKSYDVTSLPEAHFKAGAQKLADKLLDKTV